MKIKEYVWKKFKALVFKAWTEEFREKFAETYAENVKSSIPEELHGYFGVHENGGKP